MSLEVEPQAHAASTESVQKLSRAKDRTLWLRRTLHLSQREAVSSSTMTSTGDNFFNAFAIYLNASAVQMGVLTAVPQLFAALAQLLSAWLGSYLPRKPLVVNTAYLQALVVMAIAALAVVRWEDSVFWLIVLSIIYFSCMSFIQPQWRAWMGSIVPKRRRGSFFAARTRLTMIASLVIFIGGGLLLSAGETLGVPWLGFVILFAVAGLGRFISAKQLSHMHDPDFIADNAMRISFSQSIAQLKESLGDKTFRDYSIFVAAMQGVVALSAPFFSVYMLTDLQFTYIEYALNSVASIATQFLSLRFWGRFGDRFGNRLMMIVSSMAIPVVPLLWLLSADFTYLLVVQLLSGVFWSAFTLSTANYIYDIRPYRSDFAVYAAMQSALAAVAVFFGAILGGLVASISPDIASLLAFMGQMRSPMYVVFVVSSLLRLGIVLWFIPRAEEPSLRKRPELLRIVFRVSRFSAISGVSLDWLSVTKRKPIKGDRSWVDDEQVGLDEL
ncbi:MAG: MFS transporter [Pseudohongiellaceae bacterium]|nr:MFS transporter [Pseudohongiellaceae bacterium]